MESPEYLSRKDLYLEKQRDIMTNRALKELEPKPEKKILRQKYKIIPIEPDGGTPERISLLNQRERAMQAQRDKMMNNAIVDDTDFQPKTIKSSVTQEMIAEYQAERAKPFMLEGTKYKYFPSTVLDSLDLEEPVYRLVATEAQLEDARREITKLSKQIQTAESLYAIIDADEIKLRNKYDADMSLAVAGGGGPVGAYDEATRRAGLKKMKMSELKAEYKALTGFDSKAKKDALVEEIIKEDKSRAGGATARLTADFEADLRDLADARAEVDLEIADLSTQIAAIRDAISNNDQNISENLAEYERVKKVNKGMLDEVVRELNVLNQGQFNLEQQPGETEEEFQQRLLDVGSASWEDADIQEAAELENIVKGQNNLKDIISDTSTRERVVALLTPEERFLMNKRIAEVKKKYLEVIGKDNRSVGDDDIVGAIRAILEQPAFEKPSKPTPAGPITTTAPPGRGKNVVPSGLTKSELISAIEEFNNGAEAVDVIEYIDTEPNQDLYDKLRSVGITRREEIKRLASLATVGLASALPVAPTAGPLPDGSMVGVGVRKLPKLSKFGKIHISPDKLYFKNTLVVRSNKGKPITGIKNVRVSDMFGSNLMKIMDGHRVTRNDLHQLPPHERQLFDSLMLMSGLHKTHDNTVEDTAQKMKERLALIEGELEAGNSNKKLLVELHALLHRMARSGLISINAAADHYKALKTIYF